MQDNPLRVVTRFKNTKALEVECTCQNKAATSQLHASMLLVLDAAD